MTAVYPLYSAENLTIGYGDRGRSQVVAADLNLTLTPGKMVCLLGPNGAGKSTLMRTLAAMEKPLAGRVLLQRENIHHLTPPQLARKLSVVLTEKIDLALLTVRDLVTLGRSPYTNWWGTLSPEDHTTIDWAIAAVGLENLAHRDLGQLSDGERQKALIARALAQETPLIFLDEPTAYLDLPRRIELMQLLRHLARSLDKSILLSTHDLDLALRSGDEIWLLDGHGGFQQDIPEALVLSGAIARVFQGKNTTFDHHSGTFQFTNGDRGPITLGGTGLWVLWTQRALERQGFVVTMDRENPQVWATENQWCYGQGTHRVRFGELGALLDYLGQFSVDSGNYSGKLSPP